MSSLDKLYVQQLDLKVYRDSDEGVNRFVSVRLFINKHRDTKN